MTEMLKNVAMIKNTYRSVHTPILLTDRCFSLCRNLCRIKLEALFAKGNIRHSRLGKARLLVPPGEPSFDFHPDSEVKPHIL